MGRVQYLIVTALALLGLVITGANIWLATGNREMQTQVAQRQQYLQQSVQLEQLYRDIARALAELGSRDNDDAVRAMLQRHGITYSVNAPAAAAPKK